MSSDIEEDDIREDEEFNELSSNKMIYKYQETFPDYFNNNGYLITPVDNF